MAASATFLTLSSLTPKTLSFSNPKFGLFSLNPSSIGFRSNPISISALVLRSDRVSPAFFSRFVRNVAVSSDFDQEEDVLDVDGDDSSYAPDLQLFVGNLPFTIDSAQLAGLFESAGQVERVEVIYDKMTGRSRGFGFVTMSNVAEAEAAAQQFNGYELEGRPLRVNYGPPPPKRDDSSFRSSKNASTFDNSNCVHVSNLAWGVDDLTLENLFREQGNVVKAKVVYDRDSGRSRGFGFVTYSSAEEVNNAIQSLDGVDLNGRSIRVTQAEARLPRRQF
ncbi:29 kDa ribonucleoprotein, chloroplastic-like [Cucurbita pepo subsp. pepo]|uniref:29 kDa ribonucleoprotein, chloroplastic-like n=1 Tax=Cucurbita pepo subsp. pepo TaxID=3664 RepID=UPI000C9D51A9|nr:29 kDa ribonucleoprotein, chloroplastic-like [Cucurbita pepo subsp. pepo]